MDERLPLGSLDAATLAMLLEKERTRRSELEAELARLRAGIARQNAVITRLEEQNRALRREHHELRTLVAGLTEQNRLLRPLVIAKKISGGTRSPAGSTTRMVLSSLAATARLQGQEPTAVYEQLLLAPPGSPSPLAAPPPLP